ncbi:hypothetical protein VPMS16_3676 [Vibrio sp. 16]|nr:hypothetical protein VPMS16_3676 [Vibrio sp. 16]
MVERLKCNALSAIANPEEYGAFATAIRWQVSGKTIAVQNGQKTN